MSDLLATLEAFGIMILVFGVLAGIMTLQSHLRSPLRKEFYDTQARGPRR